MATKRSAKSKRTTARSTRRRSPTARRREQAEADEQRRLRARREAPQAEPPVTQFEYIVAKANEGLASHEARNAKPKGSRDVRERQRKLAAQRAKPAAERSKASEPKRG